MDRRYFLRTSAGTGLATSVVIGGIPSLAAAEPSGSITFESQTAPDGQTLTIASIEVDQDAALALRNQSTDEDLYYSTIDAGTYEDHEVTVGPPLTERSEVAVSLHTVDEGTGFARETAFVDVVDDIETVDGIGQTLIDPDPAAGFEYPFYLYAPQAVTSEDTDPRPVMVEPANSGQVDDDMDVHLSAGDQLVSRGQARDIADELGSPLIVPVFPRPSSNPVDWTHYIHALDDTSMGIEGGSLERVDLQLLNMVERAYDVLDDEGYPVRTDGILLNGFSASGNFVDRFTVLHPDEVISVTAGGLNGMPLLPVDEFEGRELPYHVGTADVEALTGDSVNREALDETNQFLYMGGEDDNDTIGYGDAWTDDSVEQLALDVYGDDMITERFPTSQRAYEEAGVTAQFRIYPDAGHTPRPARSDIVEFHRLSIDGGDVSMFGERLGATLDIDVSPDNPSSASEVTFDASESTVAAGSEIISYQWEFGEDDVDIGETATHTYAEGGDFTVTLTVATDQGTQYEKRIDVLVDDTNGAVESVDADENDSNDTAETDDADDSNDTAETDDADDSNDTAETDDTSDAGASEDSVPGFGIGSVLAGIGGTAYLLKRRLIEEE